MPLMPDEACLDATDDCGVWVCAGLSVSEEMEALMHIVGGGANSSTLVQWDCYCNSCPKQPEFCAVYNSDE